MNVTIKFNWGVCPELNLIEQSALSQMYLSLWTQIHGLCVTKGKLTDGIMQPNPVRLAKLYVLNKGAWTNSCSSYEQAWLIANKRLKGQLKSFLELKLRTTNLCGHITPTTSLCWSFEPAAATHTDTHASWFESLLHQTSVAVPVDLFSSHSWHNCFIVVFFFVFHLTRRLFLAAGMKESWFQL